MTKKTASKGKEVKSYKMVNGQKKIKNDVYEKELLKLQLELVKLQEWIKEKGLKVAVIFAYIVQ